MNYISTRKYDSFTPDSLTNQVSCRMVQHHAILYRRVFNLFGCVGTQYLVRNGYWVSATRNMGNLRPTRSPAVRQTCIAGKKYTLYIHLDYSRPGINGLSTPISPLSRCHLQPGHCVSVRSAQACFIGHYRWIESL